MAGKSAAGKALCLSGGYTNSALYMSLHSADPGTTGASEISGGSPAYARQLVTWGAPSAGASVGTPAAATNVPAGTTVAYIGLWSAATGGTYYDGVAITSETFAAQGTYQITSITETITS